MPDVIQFTIPPGDGPTVISVPIFDDVIDEDSDQYVIGVLRFSGNPTGAVLGRDAILMGIQDNDRKRFSTLENHRFSVRFLNGECCYCVLQKQLLDSSFS